MSLLEDMCGDTDKGEAFDDGAYDAITKLTIGDHETDGVVYLKIEYIKDGDVVEKQHGSVRGEEITELVFGVDHPDEYITCIRGSFKSYAGKTVLQLRLRTSRGRSSQMYGEHPTTERCGGISNDPFDWTCYGRKLVGFHGRSGDVINALGVRFASVPSAHAPSQLDGGSYGVMWDDGGYDEGVKKVWVGERDGHLSYMKIQYCSGDVWLPLVSQDDYFDGVECIKNMITHSHGEEPPEELLKEFEMLDDDEYITSVEATCHDYDVLPEMRALTSLKFKTSYNRESPLFGKSCGRKFIIQGDPRFQTKLVGFKGLSEPGRLIGLGGYFTVAPPRTFSVAEGGDSGHGYSWNHGVHGGIHKIKVASGWTSICSMEFEYIDDDGNVTLPADDGVDYHPYLPPDVCPETFQFYPGEYITSVEVFMSYYNHYNTLSVSMLKIKTNREFSHRVIGSDFIGCKSIKGYDSMKYAKTFLLQKRGHKIVGFFGRSSVYLEDIGVYFEPI